MLHYKTIPNTIPAVEPLQVMEGVIDIVYRWHNQIWVADYKTHMADDATLESLVQEYYDQVNVYQKAVSQALGISPVRGQLIFVRIGRAVEVSAGYGDCEPS